MEIEINSPSKTIPESNKVYILRPGKSGSFLSDFLSKNVVFLDLPKMELPPKFSLTDDLKRKIHMARAFSTYYRSSSISLDIPPIDPAKYDPKKGLDDKRYTSSDGQTFKSVQTLYFEAKDGDIVICHSGGMDSPIYVGEIQGEYNQDKALITKYGEQEVPARKVKWLRKNRRKYDFSFELTQQLRNPRALFLLKQSLRQEIYDYAYGIYELAEEASITVRVSPPENPQDHIDPLALSSAQNLVLYLNAMHNALKNSELSAFNQLSFEAAIASDYYKVAPLSAEYEIHSPGSVIYRAQQGAKVGFIAAVLALTSYPNVAEAQEYDVMVKNEWNEVPSSCDVEVADSVKHILLHLNLDQWQRLCEERKKADAAIKFESSTTANVTDNSVTREKDGGT